MEITKEEFKAFVEVQNSGLFNMFMDGCAAAQAAGLTFEKYKEILFNYDSLKRKYS